MDRRGFFKQSGALGAGLILGFHLPERQALGQPPAAPAGPLPPNAFVRIAPDNSVTILSKHTEMGQGSYTGLATLLAEELDADWSQVRVEPAPVNLAYYVNTLLGIQGTGGSSSLPSSWEPYRRAGATARAMLVEAAADKWGVPAREISVDAGVISHPASGRQGSFGEFSEIAAALQPPAEVALKDPADFKLIGRELPRLDTRAKVDGSARYTLDLHRPGMLTAVVLHAPRFGARLLDFDDRATRQVPGVREVVAIPSGVAVLADSTWAALKGRERLSADWDFSKAEQRGDSEIVAEFEALLDQPGVAVEKKGDSDTALGNGTRRLEATFVFPYLAHACMEPLDCTLEVEGDRAVIRSGTQMPSVERDRVAAILGLAPEKVSVELHYAGGGFGRRGNFVPEIATETAHIVKATEGRWPVKLMYTREDDMTAGYYRPLFVHRLRGAVDAQGNITAWENRLVGQSFFEGSDFGFLIQNGIDPVAVEGAAHLPYAVSNVSVDYHMTRTGVPTLSWRSVGHSHTAFSKETFLDELLEAAGRDPLEGRLALMSDERAKAVLREAAKRAAWDEPVPAGRGRGLAYVESFGVRMAQIAEVSRGDDGRIRVNKVVCALDCGIAVNPDIVRAQVEGGLMFGLSAALFSEVRIEQGQVLTENFHNYPMLRIHQAPEIEVYILPSRESPAGIGEPAVPPIAPAVANAWYRLTGERVRRLPFQRQA